MTTLPLNRITLGSIRLSLLLLITALLTLSCNNTQREKDTSYDYSRISDFDSNLNITDITEDCSGYIWISTQGNGLFRYDGDNYIQYTSSEYKGSINSSTVNSLCSDSYGNLWIGTQMGINRYQSATNDFRNYPINDNWNYIVDIFEDQHKRLFATSRRGLFLFDSATEIFCKVISFENTNTPNVFVDTDKCVWVINDYSIVNYDENFNFRQIYTSDIPIVHSAFDANENIYIASSSEIKIDRKSVV